MQAGLITGEVQSRLSLSESLYLEFEETEKILVKLMYAKIVRQLSETDWVMIRNPEHISLGELSDLFLLDASTLPSQAGDAKIHAWFAMLAKCMEEPRNMTLQNLISV
jgi:hypothetical protein